MADNGAASAASLNRGFGPNAAANASSTSSSSSSSSHPPPSMSPPTRDYTPSTVSIASGAASQPQPQAEVSSDDRILNMLKKEAAVAKRYANANGAYDPNPTGSSQHARTASDSSSSAALAPSSLAKSGLGQPTLLRSNSIAASGDKSLALSALRSAPMLDEAVGLGVSNVHQQPQVAMMHHESQLLRKQYAEAMKKLEQAAKDADFYHHEAESFRSRYNEVLVEKQRSEQECDSLRIYIEDERKENAELRSQLQSVSDDPSNEAAVATAGSNVNVLLMRNYEAVKEDYTVLRTRFDELAGSHGAAVAKLEHLQVGNRKECHFSRGEYSKRKGKAPYKRTNLSVGRSVEAEKSH